MIHQLLHTLFLIVNNHCNSQKGSTKIKIFRTTYNIPRANHFWLVCKLIKTCALHGCFKNLKLSYLGRDFSLTDLKH